jgi:hypothetical protein
MAIHPTRDSTRASTATMKARKTTLLVVFLLIQTAGRCEAWRRDKPSLALASVRVVLAPPRGGTASASEPSSTPDDDFPHPKKKRRINPKEVEDDDEYEEGEDDLADGEEQEWFEASEELTGAEDIMDDNDGGFNVIDDDEADDDDEPGRSRQYDDAASVEYEGDEDEAIGDLMSSSVGVSITGERETEDEESAGRMPDDDDDNAAPVVTTSSSFAATARDDELAHHQELDDGSSTDHLDRLDLADAYDDDVAAALTTPSAADHTARTSLPVAAAAVVASIAPAGAAAAAAATPTDDDDTAMMIDAATARILQNELKYRPKEIKSMKPAVAAVVAAKRLHRPTEGMPRNWYRAGTDGSNLLQSKNQRRLGVVKKWGQVVLPRIIVPVAVIGLAIVQKDSIGEVLSSVLARTRRTARRPDGPKLRDDNTPTYDNDDIGSIYDDSLLQIENDDNNNNDSSSPPRVKEAAATRPTTFKDHQTTTTNELDVTWLDKCLTAIERRFKAFMRWEI